MPHLVGEQGTQGPDAPDHHDAPGVEARADGCVAEWSRTSSPGSGVTTTSSWCRRRRARSRRRGTAPWPRLRERRSRRIHTPRAALTSVPNVLNLAVSGPVGRTKSAILPSASSFQYSVTSPSVASTSSSVHRERPDVRRPGDVHGVGDGIRRRRQPGRSTSGRLPHEPAPRRSRSWAPGRQRQGQGRERTQWSAGGDSWRSPDPGQRRTQTLGVLAGRAQGPGSPNDSESAHMPGLPRVSREPSSSSPTSR